MTIHNYKNKIVADYKFGDQVYVGDITVIQIPDALDHVVVQKNANDSSIHDPDWVRSQDQIRGLFLALNFKDRVKVFDHLVGDLNSGLNPNARMYLETLAGIFLSDIALELDYALIGTFRSSPEKRQRTLRYLSDYKFKNKIYKGSPAEEVFAKIWAGTHLLKHYKWSAWELATVFRVTNGRTTAAYTSSYIDKTAMNIYAVDNYNTSAFQDAWLDLKSKAFAPLDEKAKWYHWWYWLETKSKVVSSFFQIDWTERADLGVRSSSHMWLGRVKRMLSSEAFDQMVAADRADLAKWVELFDQNLDVRSQLILGGH